MLYPISPIFAQNICMQNQRPLFFLIVLFFSSQLFAQNSNIELDSVTVTATRSVQNQKETGRNITVIRGEQFDKLPVHSIDELLRYLPGIEIQQRGPEGSSSDIVIRGGTFQQVLVIIDGVKLNDPLTGHFNTFIPIHPAEIDRIEILKGAASAIWGSEAVGGVVNIITKTFSGNSTRAGNTVKGKVALGEYGLFNAATYFSVSRNKSTFSGGVLSNNAKGQPLRGTNGFFHLTTVNLSFSQQLPKDWVLHFRSASDFRKFNAQNFYTTFSSDTANEKVNSWWNHLNLEKKTMKGVLNFDAAYKQLRDQFWFTPSATPNDNKTNVFTTQLYYTASIKNKSSYTTGVQFSRKQIISNDRGNHSLLHGAVYTILRHTLGSNVHLNESLRLDWDENYGAILVPQVNFAWTPSKFTFRASGGRSFRDADFTERYNNYNKVLVTSGRIGNPDLKPEHSWNAEAGADYSFSYQLKISTTIFYRDHTNLIDYANTPYNEMPRKDNLSPAGTYALAKNIEKVKTTGLELDMIYSKKLNENSTVLVNGGFTWLQSKNNDPAPSFYISSHAKYLLNFSALYSIHAFSFSVTGLYKKRDEQKSAAINAEITPSYFVLNAKGVYQFSKKFDKLFIEADNLFDKRYSDLLGAMMPGRWLSGGFEIAL